MAPEQREQRYRAVTRDLRRCQHCGATGPRLEPELVDPAGPYEAANLRTACARCRLERRAVR